MPPIAYQGSGKGREVRLGNRIQQADFTRPPNRACSTRSAHDVRRDKPTFLTDFIAPCHFIHITPVRYFTHPPWRRQDGAFTPGTGAFPEVAIQPSQSSPRIPPVQCLVKASCSLSPCRP